MYPDWRRPGRDCIRFFRINAPACNSHAYAQRLWDPSSRPISLSTYCSPDLILELGPKVSEHMRENYKPDSVIPEETYTVLPRLRQSGYILGVVSNRSNPYQDEIEGFAWV